MQTLQTPVLVLNKNWSAIQVEPFEDSLRKIFSNRARFLDENSMYPCDWDTWVYNQSLSRDEDITKYPYNWILTGRCWIRIPEIIVLSVYGRIPRCNVTLNRKNIWIRDKGICQYSGQKVSLSEATWDHVIPESRGGLTSWCNLVLCSFDINVRKSNRTPQEAGLTLIRKPEKPNWSPLFTYLVANRTPPESWKKFIAAKDWEKCYWDVELE